MSPEKEFTDQKARNPFQPKSGCPANFTLPDASKYILRGVMDPQNEITETDETNNELIATVYSCDIFLALDFLKEKILSLP
ncbi:MAG: CARDB domain-containing protein, partial [Thermoplasmata archaeon]